MKKEKLLLIIMVLGSITLIAGWLLWLFMNWSATGLDMEIIALSIPLLIITIAMIMIAAVNFKNIRRGLPMKDEMSKRIEYKAGACTFFIGIYWLLFLGMFGDAYFERPSQATGAGILGMAIIFLVLWVYFNKKGV